MKNLRSQSEKVPPHVVIGEEGSRIPTLSISESREEQWVFDGEHGEAETDEVKVPVFGVKFYSEASSVSSCVCSACVGYCCWKPDRNRSLFVDLVQEFGFADVGDVVGHLKKKLKDSKKKVSKSGK